VKNGIDPFECLPERRSEIRDSLGLPASAILVALVSRATYDKGIDFAIQCLAEIGVSSAPGAEIHFVHCGDGPNLQEFQALASQLGVADRFCFLGRRLDVRRILCACDLAFHPSRHEGLSLSTLEFMCAGLPVIVPDVPSVCAPIQNSKTGLVYPAGDVGAAVKALLTLSRDRDQRIEMGRRAREHCISQYSLETTGRDFDKQVLPWI
jgi:glycosyltransferase involved in cell wall biosynthesis